MAAKLGFDRPGSVDTHAVVLDEQDLVEHTRRALRSELDEEVAVHARHLRMRDQAGQDALGLKVQQVSEYAGLGRRVHCGPVGAFGPRPKGPVLFHSSCTGTGTGAPATRRVRISSRSERSSATT